MIGIRTINEDHRIQIDENYASLLPVSLTPEPLYTITTAGFTYGYVQWPPSAYVAGDLVLGRPDVGSDKYVCRGQPGQLPVGALQYRSLLLRPIAGMVGPPATGMGIKILTPLGQNAFSTDENSINNRFELVQYGIFDPYPSSTEADWALGTVPDLDKYWCAINSVRTEGSGGVFFGINFTGYYQYVWTSGTAGYIKLHSSGSIGTNATSNPWPYMIFKDMT